MRRRTAALLVCCWSWALASRGLESGGTIPDITVGTVDGQQFSLVRETSTHQAFVIVFLSTSCPYSNFYNKRLPEMAAAYSERGVAFLAVFPNRSEGAEQVRTHARRNGFLFPVARDAELTVTRGLGAVRTPEVFVFDSAGTLRYRGQVASKFGSPDLANALEALLHGREVKVRVTKAFGCAIEGR